MVKPEGIMHLSSALLMERFFKVYLKPNARILEVGSCDSVVYRQIVTLLGYDLEYIGMDIKEGFNVDVAVKNDYDWLEFEDNSFDIVIAGQVFEHAEFFWLTIKEMARVLKPKGHICVISPRRWKEHKHPVDCWRFLPGGMRALAKWANLKCVEAVAARGIVNSKGELRNDCMGVFQK